MDPSSPLFAILSFVLLSIVVIGGYVLLMPLSRQLAKFLEFRMQDKQGIGDGTDELRLLRAAVEGFQKQLDNVSDRQAFIEKMLESRDRDVAKLPR